MSRVYYPQCRVILSCVFDGFGGEDSDPQIIQVIPKDAQVNLTGYKEADTWSLTFDAKALPFSPDLLRSVAVEIYMYDAKGIDLSDIEIWAMSTEENLLVAGLADNAELTLSKDGRVFVMDGRDYTGLLLDRQWDVRKRVPTGKSLTQVVQELVDIGTGADKHGGFTLKVEYVSEKPEPIVGAYKTKTNKKGVPVKDSQAGNVWDIIYKVCGNEGCIVFVRNHTVIITDPQTLTLQNANRIRHVVYGRNLASLQVQRKLGKEKVPQIKVNCYSSKLRRTISGVFPPDGVESVTTGIGTKKDETVTYVVDGVDDEEQLNRIAESRYNDIARGEMKIHFTTKSLTDVSSTSQLNKNDPFDLVEKGVSLLQLRAGDPCSIGFDPFNEQVMQSMTPEQREAYLVEKKEFSRPVAYLVANEYEKIHQFNRPFYVRDVGITWGHQEGITLDVEAVNFAVIKRDDKTAKADPAKAARKLPKSTDNSKVGK